MKAILEFDLPEDEHEHRQAVQAGDAFLAIEEIYQYLRSQAKHGDPPDDIHAVKERFHQILNEHGIEM